MQMNKRNTCIILAFICYCFEPSTLEENKPCMLKKLDRGAIVCVCNSSYCDTLIDVEQISKGSFVTYTSSRSGLRFKKSMGKFRASNVDTQDEKVTIKIDSSTTYQKILGFGGAVTDAAALTIADLDESAQKLLHQSYFGKYGLGYSIIRVNMAGCDFSTRVYSYDDVESDFSLGNFSLAVEDLKYKIPLIKSAMDLSNGEMRVFASPWSAPAWMKTNKKMYGKGSLIGKPGGKYYKTWAQYYVRFLREYKKHGVPLWGLTVLNEPTNGFVSNFRFNCMGLSAEDERDFIVNDLGPALDKSEFSNISLMILDDQRLVMLDFTKTILMDKSASKYISGIGVHWYWDWLVPPSYLNDTHHRFPDKYILATEACSGYYAWDKKVDLGNWKRGEDYAHDIIQDLSNWVVGWTDWNIALNMNGGPNWAKNFVDSPVIVDAENKVFYKQPMFYAMGHFSKFVKPGCLHMRCLSDVVTDVEYICFACPDSSLVTILLNRNQETTPVTIYDPKIGLAELTLEGHSIVTVIWWR